MNVVRGDLRNVQTVPFSTDFESFTLRSSRYGL